MRVAGVRAFCAAAASRVTRELAWKPRTHAQSCRAPRGTDMSRPLQLGESAARCYAAKVYPAHDPREAVQITSRMRILYRHVLSQCPRAMLTPNETKSVCGEWQAELVVRDSMFAPGLFDNCDGKLTNPFLNPKSQLMDCELRARTYMPPWAASISPADNWIEVTHFAFAGKRGGANPRAPKNWRQFVDGGLSGWWYSVTPGSGIFYRSGVTKLAPTKAAMLATLLSEWSNPSRTPSAESSPASSATPMHARILELVRHLMRSPSTNMNKRMHLKPDLTPTEAAKIFGAWQADHDRPLHVTDEWDSLLVRLGRTLGYDTLMFTTELDQYHLAVTASLVDLRSPFGAELFNQRLDLLQLGEIGSASLVAPVGAMLLDEAKAFRWAGHVAEHTLCVGDPRARGRASRATCDSQWRCNFTRSQPTVRLACPGHASWAVRNMGPPACQKL